MSVEDTRARRGRGLVGDPHRELAAHRLLTTRDKLKTLDGRLSQGQKSQVGSAPLSDTRHTSQLCREGQGQSRQRLRSGELCPHWAEETTVPPAELGKSDENRRHPARGSRGQGSWFPQIFVGCGLGEGVQKAEWTVLGRA